MNAELATKTTLELVIQLVDTIIWPVTLLILVLLFRRNLADVVQRLGTLKADRSGIELSFQKQIEATKQLFKEIKPVVSSKSAPDIQSFNEINNSPFADILAARSNLINHLRIIAAKEGIKIDNHSPEMIIDKLKETGSISIQQSKMINAMLEVTAAANASATKTQAEEIEDLMKQIEIL